MDNKTNFPNVTGKEILKRQKEATMWYCPTCETYHNNDQGCQKHIEAVKRQDEEIIAWDRALLKKYNQEIRNSLGTDTYDMLSEPKSVSVGMIEQIKIIIDDGGPYFVSLGLDIERPKEPNIVGIYDNRAKRKAELIKQFQGWYDAENECERLNADWVARKILEALKDINVDYFTSVYDKTSWRRVIDKILNDVQSSQIATEMKND